MVGCSEMSLRDVVLPKFDVAMGPLKVSHPLVVSCFRQLVLDVLSDLDPVVSVVVPAPVVGVPSEVVVPVVDAPVSDAGVPTVGGLEGSAV